MSVQWTGRWGAMPAGVQWLADNEGQLIGYRDSRNRHYEIRQVLSSAALMAAKTAPTLAQNADAFSAAQTSSGAVAVPALNAAGAILNAAGTPIPTTLPLQASDPAAPASGCVTYAKDNGSGKTGLYARFPTGAIQLYALEP